MALTQKQIHSLTPKERRQQFGCGDGLNIIIEPAHKGGGKSFEGRYRMKIDGITNQIPVRIEVFGGKPGQHSLRQALTQWNEIKHWAKQENRDPRQFGKKESEPSSLTFSDHLCRLDSTVGVFVQRCRQQFTEPLLLDDVGLELGLQFVLDQALEQFHRQVFLGDLGDLDQTVFQRTIEDQNV